MGKRSTRSRSESRPEWEQLEDWVRGHVQRLIQELLEEEVTEFLGRAKSARRSESDNERGYRNGYGKPRRLTLSSGTVQLRRPRVRNTEEEFESRLLPLFVNRTRKVAELIPQLYLHGLSEGDFDLAVRGLLGEEAPISASTVARLKDKWNDELAQWRARPLDDLEVVYMWVDGVYVKAGLEREKAAILVVMAALSDGRKVVVSAIPGYRESIESWSDVLRDMRRRGLECPRLVIGDGHLGIWGALRNVYPQAAEQRCWNHKILNGFPQVDVIQAWLPLMLFAILFGLSMDYQVFLISRIRERYVETHNNEESVAYGLRSTAGLITGAALIMVAIFGGFAAGDLIPVSQFGFGMAVAILLDATVVRIVLVPSTMKLLGRRNWYLPALLDWLPEIQVERPEVEPIPLRIEG